MPSFVLLVIKALLKAYHREDLIAALVDYQVHLRYATSFLSSNRTIEIPFNPLNRLTSAYFGAFVYAVPDARGLMPALGAIHLMAAVHFMRQFVARTSASNMEVNSCYHPLRIGLLS